MRRLLLSGLVVVLAASCGGAPEVKADTPAAQGEEIAESKGCLSCHTVDGSKGIAPTWKGLYMSRVELTTGETVIADEEYLRHSMLQPSAQTVKDYQEGLMETAIKPDSLKEEEVRALIAYIRSLR